MGPLQNDPDNGSPTSAGWTSPTGGEFGDTGASLGSVSMRSVAQSMPPAVHGITGQSKCAIFWDFENCAPPQAVPGYVVVENIRKAVMQFGPIVQFRAYFEVKESSGKTMRSELQSSGVSIIDTPHNARKDAADKMIMVDMLSFAMDFAAPATIVLISGDRDFVYALSVLRNRAYNIILIVPNKGASLVLRTQASVLLEWRYDILSQDVVSRFQRERDEAAQRVSNLAKSTSQLLAAGGSIENLVAGMMHRSGSSQMRVDLMQGLDVGGSGDQSGGEGGEGDDALDEIPVYSPMAPGFFDVLMDILNASRLSGGERRLGEEPTRVWFWPVAAQHSPVARQ
nr:hypothetical protein HK105_001622 [Polyrhizophydium stewartii]